MAVPFLNNLTIAVFKLEGVPGTAETLVDADYNVRIRKPEISIVIEPDDDSQKFQTGDHAEDEAIMGAQSCTINCFTKMAWSGSVSVEPKWWKLMKASGAKEKTYTTTGIALQPQKAYDNKTVTCEVYNIQMGATPAAMKYVFAGCIANATVGASGIGMPLIANYSFTGKCVDIADVANANILALTAPDTTLPEKLLSSTVTMGGVTQRISEFSLDFGNQIQPVINQAESTGYEFFGITERRPRFSMNPLAQPVATEDILEIVKTATTKVISIATTNMTLKIPVAQLLAPGIATREGYGSWDQSYRCLRNGSVDSDIAAESTWELLIGARA